MPVMFNGVPVTLDCREGVDTITEKADFESGLEAKVILKCAWAERFRVYQGLAGRVTLQGTQIVRTAPAAYPVAGNMFCVGWETKGIKYRTDVDGTETGIPGWGMYEFAIITANFKTPGWETENGEDEPEDPSGLIYCTTRFKTSAEVFSPPNGAYYYQKGTFAGKPVLDSSVGQVRSRVEISMTRHYMPKVPLNQIMNLQGMVNQSPITFADFTFPQGCLLFLCANTDPQPEASTGVLMQDIEYQLMGNKDVSWNSLMDPSGQYVPVNTAADGSGNAPFTEADLTVLFGDDLSAIGD